MKQYKNFKNSDKLYLPMAKLRAPQTGHCILQILAEVKDILHGPLPLGFGVCGSAMQNTKVIKHLDYQNKTQIQAAVLLWPVLVF